MRRRLTPIPSRGYDATIRHNAGGLCAMGLWHTREEAALRRSPMVRAIAPHNPRYIKCPRGHCRGRKVAPRVCLPRPPRPSAALGLQPLSRLPLPCSPPSFPSAPKGLPTATATATAHSKSVRSSRRLCLRLPTPRSEQLLRGDPGRFGKAAAELVPVSEGSAPAVCLQRVAPCSPRQGLRKSRDEAARPLTRLRLGTGGDRQTALASGAVSPENSQ